MEKIDCPNCDKNILIPDDFWGGELDCVHCKRKADFAFDTQIGLYMSGLEEITKD